MSKENTSTVHETSSMLAPQNVFEHLKKLTANFTRSSAQVKTLPPAVTHALVQQLPPESQDMAAAALEMGVAMEEAEVAELVASFQASAGASGTTGGPGDGSQGAQPNAKAATDQYWKVAKTLSFSEMRRVGRWVKQGPCGLQVLSFLGGLLLAVAAFFGIFLSLARLEIAVLAIQM